LGRRVLDEERPKSAEAGTQFTTVFFKFLWVTGKCLFFFVGIETLFESTGREDPRCRTVEGDDIFDFEEDIRKGLDC